MSETTEAKTKTKKAPTAKAKSKPKSKARAKKTQAKKTAPKRKPRPKTKAKAKKPKRPSSKPKTRAAQRAKTRKPRGRPKRGPKGKGASDLIRSLPADMPAKDVVEAGAKKDIVFSQQLVYNVRAAARRGNGKKQAHKKARRGLALYSGSGSEKEFRQLIVDLGTARSRELIDEIETALQSVVAG